jgi:hypothetical protein
MDDKSVIILDYGLLRTAHVNQLGCARLTIRTET